MTDRTPDEVLDLARQRIAWRKEQEQQRARAIHKPHPQRDAMWRTIFFSILGVAVLGLLLTPGIPLDQKMIIVLQGVCSQEHNIVLGGLQFPMCARCSGIYLSTTMTVLYVLMWGRSRAGRMPPRSILAVLALFVVIMGIDGINSTLETLGLSTFYAPRNDLRTLTGIGMGTGIGATMLVILNLSLRKDVDQQQRVINNWGEFAPLLGLNFLMVVAIFGNLQILAWPLSMIVFLSVVGILFTVNLLFASMLLGYDGAVERAGQLFKPATFAVIVTMVMLAGFSLLRAWLEQQAGL
jgi:uncharacterized membrane protein